MLWDFMEIALIVLIAVLVFTQVLYPAWKETPLFPLFRKRGKLEKKMTGVRGAVSDAELANKIRREGDRLKRTRQSAPHSAKGHGRNSSSPAGEAPPAASPEEDK